jgi:DNA (cytosine-5)-methyltransferase 1
MKYLSLFSGIGGFEIAIHNTFPDAECVGYSEVDKFAIQVYQHHFPTHTNLGDIRNITKEQLIETIHKAGGCDLVVGGFPCQNLSSLAHFSGHNKGLQGQKSGLFTEMYRILRILKEVNPNLHLIIENNASMTKQNQNEITEQLQSLFSDIQCHHIDNATFGVQRRRRLYWTRYNISHTNPKSQTWNDILTTKENAMKLQLTNKQISKNNLPISKQIIKQSFFVIPNENGICSKIPQYNIQRHWWNLCRYSITYDKCIPITRQFNYIMDTRFGNDNEFIVRKISSNEMEKLFFLPDGWVSDMCSYSRCSLLLGNTVSVKVIEFLLESLKNIL